MIETHAYIQGMFINKKQKISVISPLNNKILGVFPSLEKKEIDKAFECAKNAFLDWKKQKNNFRINKIIYFNKLLIKNKKYIANLMNKEIGKNINDSIIEIERTIQYIDKTIDSWKKNELKKEKINNKKSFQYNVPLGVILAISPFNYPVNLSLSKIIPALLTGNTVVFKAATNGSLTGGFIAKLIDETQFPPGVFNYISGRGCDIGEYIISHKGYDMISFTGSTYVGKKIAKKINMKPYVLELGGNDAAYIRFDAEIEKTVNEIVSGAYSFSGQRCTAIKRIIIHEKIYNQFLQVLIKKISKIKLDPIINEKSVNFIKKIYQDSLKRNDEIIIKPIFKNNYISPSLIKTTTSSKVWKEEVFGPILPIVVVKDDYQAIKIINDTNFGLQNSIFTSDIKWAQSIALNIESGTVNINSKSSRGPDDFPFLGVKDSGFGVQGIKQTLYSMTRILNIVNNE